MKSSRIGIILTGCALVLVHGSLVAAGDVVLAPAKRQEVLNKAKKLLAPREVVPAAVDPFHSEKFAEIIAGPRAPVAAAVMVAPKSDRDILQGIAANLKPSGNFVMDGVSTLLFGQKRVKAGEHLTITFEGTEYTLEIAAIERTSFTLRLNREEFTRPIK
ncbi:MAG: hypothetical protein ABI273_14840 [Lacunisphaera sp.]